MDEAHRLMKKATGTIGTLMAELEKVERYLRTHKRMNDKVRAALDSVIENWEGSGKGIVESIEGLGKQLEQAEAERGKCEWVENLDDGYWETSCGGAFVLNEGPPSRNGMKFCCYCGASLRERIDEDE